MRWWRVVSSARWIAAPWTDLALLAALVAAFATPVVAVTAVDVWRAATEDDLARRVMMDRSVVRNGIDIEIDAALSSGPVASVDAAVREAIAALDLVAAPRRILTTRPVLASVGEPPINAGPSVRLLATDGALDAVEVVQGRADADGVLVSTWFAERHGLTIGRELLLPVGPEAVAALPIMGLYDPLWSPDGPAERDRLFDLLPRELLPTFSRVFGRPATALVIGSERALLDRGIRGVVRFTAPLDHLPPSAAALRDLRSRYAQLDAALVGTSALGDAVAELIGPGGVRPTLRTALPGTVAELDGAAAQLHPPLDAARWLGGTLGLLVTAAAGAFVVLRRRTDVRLLAAEGEGALRMTARFAGQQLAPAAVGGAVGLLIVAVVATAAAGPDARRAITWSTVVLTAAAAWLLASAVAGWTGSRLLEPLGSEGRRVAVIAAAVGGMSATVFTWIQVGQASTDTAGLDLAGLALPVLGIATGVGLLLWLTRMAIGRALRGRSMSLTPQALLLLRRLASGAMPLTLATAAAGLGAGLVVFAVTLTATVDATLEVTLAAEVGARSSVDLLAELPGDVALPGPSTVVLTRSTQIVPGRDRAFVVAVDPDTFAAAARWQDAFGSGVDEVLDDLAEPTAAGAVPVLALTGQGTPASGAFGASVTTPFEVVGRLEGFPLAVSGRRNLLARADTMDAAAAMAAGFDRAEDATAAGVVLPSSRFGRVLLSPAPLAEVVTSLDTAGVRHRDGQSLDLRRRDPRVLATRAALSYLGVLGVLSSVVAAVALGLYLAARRRGRALSGAIVRSMGVTPSMAALTTSAEVTAVLAVALGAALLAVPPVVTRLTGRFDPAPTLPPPLQLSVPWAAVAGGMWLALVLVAGAVWGNERRAARRPAAEALRRG